MSTFRIASTLLVALLVALIVAWLVALIVVSAYVHPAPGGVPP